MTQSEADRRYRTNHPELYRAVQERYRLAHPDRIRIYHRLKNEKTYHVSYPSWWLCDICNKPISLSDFDMCLDPDHLTKQFRGWLCQKCNQKLGIFEKHKEKFERYLNKARMPFKK